MIGLWWQAVPGRGNLCSACHENWCASQRLGPIVPTKSPDPLPPTAWELFADWCGRVFRRKRDT